MNAHEGRAIEDSANALLAKIFDEFDSRDFRSAERIVAMFERQGVSPAHYPKVRPEDCRRTTMALKELLDSNQRLFKLGDREVIDRFWALADDFAASTVSLYPTELHHLWLLRAEARLSEGDPVAALRELGPISDRIYLIEGDADLMRRVLYLRHRALALSGHVEVATRSVFQAVNHLMRLTPRGRSRIFREFSSVIALGPRRPFSQGVLNAIANRAARVATAAGRSRGSIRRTLGTKTLRQVALAIGFAALRVRMITGEIAWKSDPSGLANRIGNPSEIIVTRAMGGIGDLVMMTPGLRRAAKIQGKPVKFATKKVFFPLFANNPHVELIDINGPAFDPFAFRKWRNLSFCPAGRYESLNLPKVKKNRIELFARGMGIKSLSRSRKARKLDLNFTEEQTATAKAFLIEKGLGQSRPLIGVQPFSRDAYKDHPEIRGIIADLAKSYDVLIFHHAPTEFEALDGVASTAGCPLEHSLALVAECSSMVCVDSAFLHVAAACDLPIVCLFGPTDGPLFTRDYEHVEVVSEASSFMCMPCWRNEDLPCQISNDTGISPCIAAIRSQKVQAALTRVRRGANIPD